MGDRLLVGFELDADHAPGRAGAENRGSRRVRIPLRLLPAAPAAERFAERRLQLGHPLRPAQEGDPSQLDLAAGFEPDVFLPGGDRRGGGGGEVLVDAAGLVAERRQVALELLDVLALADPRGQGPVGRHRPVHQQHRLAVQRVEAPAAADHVADRRQRGHRPGEPGEHRRRRRRSRSSRWRSAVRPGCGARPCRWRRRLRQGRPRRRRRSRRAAAPARRPRAAPRRRRHGQRPPATNRGQSAPQPSRPPGLHASHRRRCRTVRAACRRRLPARLRRRAIPCRARRCRDGICRGRGIPGRPSRCPLRASTARGPARLP